MSIEAMKWAKKQKTGTVYAKIVLLLLSDYSDVNGVAWPSVDRLADESHCSRRTVFRELAALEEKGFITRQKRPRKDGHQSTNLYTLHIDSQGAAQSPRRVPQRTEQGATDDISGCQGGTHNSNRTVRESSKTAAHVESLDFVSLGEELAEVAGFDLVRWTGDYSVVRLWLGRGYDPDKDIRPAVAAVMQRQRLRDPGWVPSGLQYFGPAIADQNRDRLAGTLKPDGTRMTSIQQNTPEEQRAQHIEDFVTRDGLWLGSWGDKPTEAELTRYRERQCA